MQKVNVTNIFGQSWKPEYETLEQANEWLAQHIANNTFGLAERWLPDYLEGAETRQTLVQPAFEYPAIDLEGNPTGEMVQSEAVYNTEYLHPAEYSYEVIEESLDVVKARKIAELSAISLAKNEWISGNKAYQAINIAMGWYIAEGKKSKEDGYKAEFIARSTQLTTELDRCVALVNVATDESSINAITFSIE